MKIKELLSLQRKSREAIDSALALWALYTPAPISGPHTREIRCPNAQGQQVKVTCVYMLEQVG